MYKPESTLKNERYKILWDFEIQTDHSILSRIPNLDLIYKKKNLSFSGFYFSSKPQTESERRGKSGRIPEPYQRTEKVVEHGGNGDINYSWSP